MFTPRISLDQWRSLNAVVETGGYAQAAAMLNRSQSSVSYHIARLQDLLGIEVFRIVGRRARLTEHGEVIGVVFAGDTRFHEIAFSATYNQLRLFIKDEI